LEFRLKPHPSQHIKAAEPWHLQIQQHQRWHRGAFAIRELAGAFQVCNGFISTLHTLRLEVGAHSLPGMLKQDAIIRIVFNMKQSNRTHKRTVWLRDQSPGRLPHASEIRAKSLIDISVFRIIICPSQTPRPTKNRADHRQFSFLNLLCKPDNPFLS
jgi:hypothetical protein